jgi:multiple sugar transport system ATP-binding protein
MATVEFDHVTKRFPDGTVAVDDLCLKVNDGEFMILVGPSGCGKTTALRMLAGLEEVSGGNVLVGGSAVTDIEPADRDLAMVFQTYALYPHMSVAANLAFPLRMRKIKKSAVTPHVKEVAALLGIENLLHRKPAELSGGQRQRVAMGRAIVRRPQGFLMDEPLSNLDAKLRVQMRAELADLHDRLGVTTLYVTHDQAEAMTLGQRVAVLNNGLVQQVDTPRHIYDYPTNTFVAKFIGSPPMNLILGRLLGSTVRVGSLTVTLPEHITRGIGAGERDVLVGVRPEYFDTSDSASEETVSLAVQVERIEELGSERVAHFRADGLRVTDAGENPIDLGGLLQARLGARTAIRAGSSTELVLHTQGVRLFEVSTGDALGRPREAPAHEIAAT